MPGTVPTSGRQPKTTTYLPFKQVMALFAAALLMQSCQVDTGLEPLRCGIEGKVVFLGEPPPNTDKVVVVAAYTFPPTGAADLAFSDPLPLDADSTTFRLVLPPGDYPLIGVLWKETGFGYEIWNLFGAYFEAPGDFMPGVITVPDRRTYVRDVRIEADFSRVQPHSESSVSGLVHWKGAAPPDLEEIRLIASLTFPPRNFLDLKIGPTVPVSTGPTAYDFPLPPGEYALVAAVAKLKGQDWDPSNIVGLHFSSDSLSPGRVVVPDAQARVTGVDVMVDLGRIARKTDSGVRGVVRVRGSIPQDVSKGYLIASRRYPPGSLLDVALGPTVTIQPGSTAFAFSLPPGTYEFLGLLLPGPSGNIDFSSIAAFYRDPQDTLSPARFEIPDATSWLGPVELTVDFTRGAIEGTVHFLGDWPENTEFVRVAAFDIVPQTMQDYYRVKGFTDPLPTGVREARYHLDLPPGTYRYIIAVWKAVGTSLLEIKQIGLYTDPQDPSKPGTVEVQAGRVTTGVDITADFGQLGPGGGLAKAFRPGSLGAEP